tara:strand:+ start:174 stop:743 length:570 start_codon:yes stop_codon:yes gene_type:complete
MANKSKEAERQNKALQDIISGREHEKEYVQVGYEGKKQEDLGGKTRESELSKVMQKVRMPWFCPKCQKAMKKRLDDKFWRMMGHCFDCQIEFENKLRVKGEFDNWAEQKMLENQKSQLKDLEQSIDDFEKTGGKKEWFNNVGVNTPMLESDKWEMGEKEFEKTISEARDFIREKREIVEKAEQQLQGAN